MRRVSTYLLFFLILCALARTPAWGAAPLVNALGIHRGRDVSQDGSVYYHETVWVDASDDDGIADLAYVSVTDTEGGVHVITAAGGPNLDWYSLSPTGLWASWTDCDTPGPAPPGVYSVTIADYEGHTDTLTADALGPVPEVSVVLLSPPPDDGLVYDTRPLFTWTAIEGAWYQVRVQRVSDGVQIWQADTGSAISAVYNFDGSAAQADLIPGESYTWLVAATFNVDTGQTDPRVWAHAYPHSFGRFTVYSPSPVIQNVEVDRGRDTSPEGETSYHERVNVWVSDADGSDDIASVVVTDTEGIDHAAARTNADAYLAGFAWEDWHTAAPPPPGPYAVTVTDGNGNADSIATAAAPWVAESTPTLLAPPPDNSLVYETGPTFSWIRSIPGSENILGIWDEATDEDLWYYGTDTATSVVYGSNGEPADPQPLIPGHTYGWQIQEWICDDCGESDPRVTIQTSPRAQGRFAVYSLDPVIQSIDLQRGRMIDAAGEEYFGEYAHILVNDTDGWDDVSITTLTPAAETHPQPDDCGNTWSAGPYTQEQCWGDWEQPDPLPVGTYIVTAEDSGGHFDTVETVSAPAPPPVQDITYPANGSVIAETIPTFTWDSVPGAERFCLCLEEAGNNTPVPWQKEDIAGDAVSILYDEDGGARTPELAAGSLYRLHIIAWFPDDDPDARVSLTSYAERIIEFWVAPKPAPVTGLQGKIVYERWEISPDKLDIIDLSAPDPSPVSMDLGGYWPHGGMAWSPDGTRIALSAFMPNEWEWGARDIYTVDVDGAGFLNLTNEPGSHYAPHWSPDGRTIIYSANPDFVPEPGTDYCGWGCGNNLFTISTDGSERAQLTSFDWPFSTGESVWSPDGAKVAFEYLELGDNCHTDIAVIDADGSGLTLLTDDMWWDSGPRWSPDGSTIAFRSDRDGFQELYLMDSDGDDLRRLTYYEGLVTGYYWAPDGQNLVVSLAPDTSDLSWGNPDLEIYVIDAAGGNPRRLTYNYWPDTNCAWWAPNTHSGLSQSLTVGNVTLTYEEVVAEGSTSIIVTEDLPAPPPGDLTFVDDFTYHLSTTATISGTVTVAVDYTETAYPPVLGERLYLLLWDGVQWVDITTAIDTASYLITGQFTPGAESDWYVALALDRPGVPEVKVMFDACTQGRPSGYGLFVADGDFSNPVRVTLPAPGTALHPECVCPCGAGGSVWSPDGTRVVMDRPSAGRLEVMDLTALIRAPGQESAPLTDEYGDPVAGGGASWSPSGDRIVYVSMTDLGLDGIAVVNADGTDQHMLYSFPGPDLPANVVWAQWSPDGARILFQMGSLGGDGIPTDNHLYLLENLEDPGGATLRQLTTDDAYAEDTPQWSPDGRHVVVARSLRGTIIWDAADIWVIDAETGIARRLTDSPDVGKCANGWCPYDGYLYFLDNASLVEKRILPDGTGEETVVSCLSVGLSTIGDRLSWIPTGVWIDGVNALPGESVTPKLGIVDAESLAGVQAKVRYTGGSDTLNLDSILKAESILDWAMPSPAIGPDVASFLAYASDPETQAVSGDGHLFDLNVTNSLAAQPGDLQLLAFDDLKLSDDWGDPIERISFGGGVHTIPFAYLEVSQITGPVCADADDPVPFPITLTALDRDGLPMMDCDATVDFGTHCWVWPYTSDPVTPTSVALVEGSWSGDLALMEPHPWHQLFAHWGDIGGYSNWFQAIGKGDPSADDKVSVFDVIKVANMAIERGTWEPWQWWAGDVDRDDLVNIFDVVICANEAMAAMEAMGIGRAGAAMVTAPPTEPVIITTDVTTTGAQVVLSVNLSNCAGLAGIQVELDYDAKKLTYSGVSAGELLTGASSWTVMANDLGGQVKTIAYTPSAEVLSGGEGTILTLTFDQIGKGKAKVDVTSVELADVEGGEIECQMSAGKGRGKIKQR